MKFNVNNNQAQCPGCGKWCDLIKCERSKWHKFTCCERNFQVAVSKTDLEKLSKGKKINPPPADWWVLK